MNSAPTARFLKQLALFGLIIISSWFPSAPACAELRPFVHEKTYALPSGRKVSVEFRERRCKSGECRETDGGLWGIDSGIPRLVTAVFLVSIDGRQFHIPEKFYNDLTNTRALYVFEQQGRLMIELKGGDAAGAYTAHFLLGGMCGFERKICGEICNEIWEHSTWYNSFAYSWDPQCKSGIQ